MKRGSLNNCHVKLPFLTITEGWEGSHERDKLKNSKHWIMWHRHSLWHFEKGWKFNTSFFPGWQYQIYSVVKFSIFFLSFKQRPWDSCNVISNLQAEMFFQMFVLWTTQCPSKTPSISDIKDRTPQCHIRLIRTAYLVSVKKSKLSRTYTLRAEPSLQ